MGVFKDVRQWLGGHAGRAAEAVAAFHRDERGDLLEYALVFTAISVPLLALMYRLFDILSDYFGMIAFYVSWPFI
jgi:Flp pilus assembly pilin Flp